MHSQTSWMSSAKISEFFSPPSMLSWMVWHLCLGMLNRHADFSHMSQNLKSFLFEYSARTLLWLSIDQTFVKCHTQNWLAKTNVWLKQNKQSNIELEFQWHLRIEEWRKQMNNKKIQGAIKQLPIASEPYDQLNVIQVMSISSWQAVRWIRNIRPQRSIIPHQFAYTFTPLKSYRRRCCCCCCRM